MDSARELAIVTELQITIRTLREDLKETQRELRVCQDKLHEAEELADNRLMKIARLEGKIEGFRESLKARRNGPNIIEELLNR